MATSKKPTKTKATTKSKAKKVTKSKIKMVTKSKTKTTKKSTGKRGGFGGYAISFAGRKESAEQIFGKKPLPPGEMIKRIWKFVKLNNLANK